MVVSFYSIRGWYMLLWEIRVEFGQFQESEMSPGLFKDFMDGYFKILWVANFWFSLYQICAQNQWKHEIWRSTHLRPEFDYCSERMLICVLMLICELCVKNGCERGRKHYFVNFCFVRMLYLSVGEGWCGWGRKSC